MEKQNLENKVETPFTEYGRYTYADYLTWQMEEMVELIRGKVFRQAAAPRVIHQRVAGNVFVAFSIYLKGKKCDAFIAPFDVRLPVTSKKMKISTRWCNRTFVLSVIRTNWMRLAV